MTRMRRKVKVVAGLALIWVSGALYILHSNSHEVRSADYTGSNKLHITFQKL